MRSLCCQDLSGDEYRSSLTDLDRRFDRAAIPHAELSQSSRFSLHAIDDGQIASLQEYLATFPAKESFQLPRSSSITSRALRSFQHDSCMPNSAYRMPSFSSSNAGGLGRALRVRACGAASFNAALLCELVIRLLYHFRVGALACSDLIMYP